MDALIRRRAMIASGDSPLPYTPVDYILTAGNCYIITPIIATPPKSCEMKILLGSNTGCGLLSGFITTSGSNSNCFALARYSSTKVVSFSYYANYGSNDGMPSVEYSVDNFLPFIIKNDIKKGSQHISVKQNNSSEWTTVSKSNNNNVSSTYELRIFALYRNSQNETFAPSGTRLYYCKIYSDENYTALAFDGIPCFYEGEYGLWDKVTNSFFGNDNSVGSFSGPSNL